jgi:O-antigen/teichoic acid export membrane protein
MSLKSLARQTAIYGISTIVLRMASWLLSPYYTHVITQEEIGINATFLSYIAFLNIIYMIGMETSYFRFVKTDNQASVFKKTESVVFFNSIIWSILIILLAKPLITLLGYPGREIYIYLFTVTLFFENLCNIPFARLRQENKAISFVSYKAAYILINIALNIFLLSFALKGQIQLPFQISQDPVELIFWANMIPWTLLFLYFSPQILKNVSWTELRDSKEIISYSLPLILVGTAGMVNEVIDRPMLMYLLPGSQAENAAAVGIYSANYKLSIIMTLAIQAFRMGAEPFFFRLADAKDSKKTYAVIMDYFVIACCIILVLTSLNRKLIAAINQSDFIVAIDILPFLLLANLFLGMYYNTSIWYKATNNNSKGAIIAIIGAIITLVLNWILIPYMGYYGSALTTLVCYFSMLVISMLWGRHYYPIPYHYIYNFSWIGFSVVYSTLIYAFFENQTWIILGFTCLFLLISFYLAYRRYSDIKHSID